jgi:GABA(A) receptor-associated protein
MEEFRKKPLEYRTRESKRLTNKYIDRVPVLIQSGNKNTPETEHYKYLVPKETTIGEFINVIRKKTQIKSHQALFVFVHGVLPPSGSTMLAVYSEHCDEDGFLYITYSLENTFGHHLYG